MRHSKNGVKKLNLHLRCFRTGEKEVYENKLHQRGFHAIFPHFPSAPFEKDL